MRTLLSYKSVFSTDFFDIEASENHAKGTLPYYRLVNSDAVICCLLNPQGELIMVKQFRPNLNKVTLEFPAGSLSPNEQPIAAARREIAEETAHSCDLMPVGKFHLMMDRTINYEYVFLGLNARPIAGAVPENGIEVVTLPRSTFIESVMAGEFQQIAGLGIVQSASIHLGVDVLAASMIDIQNAYQSKNSVGVQ